MDVGSTANIEKLFAVSWPSHQKNLSEEDGPGTSLSRRKPEHSIVYFPIKRLQLMNISHYIPSQVSMAESDVKDHTESKKASFVNERKFGR